LKHSVVVGVPAPAGVSLPRLTLFPYFRLCRSTTGKTWWARH